MLLRQEIIRNLYRLGPEALGQAVFRDLELEDSEKRELLSSICSGHHLFILAHRKRQDQRGQQPLGRSGRHRSRRRLPMNCAPSGASCPWCTERKARGETLRSTTLPANQRMVKVQGSGGLMVEDLIGDLDPEAALRKGIYSPEAFLRASC